MPKRKPRGGQLDTINRSILVPQHSFNLGEQDAFVTSLGIQFTHFKAIPSPIGLKDRGDYRRSDSLDTISSNGMIYVKSGCFTATMVDNSKNQRRAEGGLVDYSTSRLIMPRYYDKADGVANGDRIYLAPGDRVYLADPNADCLVSNYQRMEYEPNQDNRPMFPIHKMEFIEDSRGIIYKEGKDFEITSAGDIRWLSGGENPGIDPDTKAGRVYAVRYLYRAYWYIVAIPKEVRLTNVTNAGVRAPERMAYHAVIQREYIYHQVNRGKNSDGSGGDVKTEDQKRIQDKPTQGLDPNGTVIRVNMDDFEHES